MQILLNFKEDISKPRIWNESLYEISNDNGFGVGNFATSKNLTVKCSMFPHHNIINSLRHLPMERLNNMIYNIMVNRRQYSSVIDIESFRAADCDADQ
jgi:hypothetical protein